MTQIENIQQTAAASAPASNPKLWKAAQQFEKVLVEQLAKQLQETAQPADGGDGDETQSGATSFYRDLLPGALADGVSAAGGLGLTRKLYDALQNGEK